MTGQSWDPDLYARNARFVSDLGMPVVALLDPRPGERILDLGCGDGVLTEKLAAFGCEVVGVDASQAQVEAARARGLDARVLDGEALPFEAEFDAVFSNAALHWMKNPGAVVEGVRRALRAGGRFVAECGGRGNVSRIRAAISEMLRRRGRDAETVNPWYFPSAEEYRRLLEAHGFELGPPRCPVTSWNGSRPSRGASAPPFPKPSDRASSSRCARLFVPISATPRASGPSTTSACGSRRPWPVDGRGRPALA